MEIELAQPTHEEVAENDLSNDYLNKLAPFAKRKAKANPGESPTIGDLAFIVLERCLGSQCVCVAEAESAGHLLPKYGFLPVDVHTPSAIKRLARAVHGPFHTMIQNENRPQASCSHLFEFFVNSSAPTVRIF